MALLVVGIGDCKVSADPCDVLVTHALGSCVAVLVYDPVARVAGLLHYMLPESSLDAGKAKQRPFMFADSGIPVLLQEIYERGGVKSRLVVVAAGGAQMLDPVGTFNIGRRNRFAMQAILARAGIPIQKQELGGTRSRTVSIDVASGRVELRTPGGAECGVLVDGDAPCPL